MTQQVQEDQTENRDGWEWVAFDELLPVIALLAATIRLAAKPMAMSTLAEADEYLRWLKSKL